MERLLLPPVFRLIPNPPPKDGFWNDVFIPAIKLLAKQERKKKK